MKDRISLYPGRVKLNPVAGEANTYDMVRADQPTQEGTALNKANLLSDETAALFGLDGTAVPNDVLSKLSKSTLRFPKEVQTAEIFVDWETFGPPAGFTSISFLKKVSGKLYFLANIGTDWYLVVYDENGWETLRKLEYGEAIVGIVEYNNTLYFLESMKKTGNSFYHPYIMKSADGGKTVEDVIQVGTNGNHDNVSDQAFEVIDGKIIGSYYESEDRWARAYTYHISTGEYKISNQDYNRMGIPRGSSIIFKDGKYYFGWRIWTGAINIASWDGTSTSKPEVIELSVTGLGNGFIAAGPLLSIGGKKYASVIENTNVIGFVELKEDMKTAEMLSYDFKSKFSSYVDGLSLPMLEFNNAYYTILGNNTIVKNAKKDMKDWENVCKLNLIESGTRFITNVSNKVISGNGSGIFVTEDEFVTKTFLTDIFGEKIGIPAEQIIDNVHIETGSYTGTGKYGSSNPNSLTFGFEPKIVFVYATGFAANCIMVNPVKSTPYSISASNSDHFIYMTWNGNTVRWYNETYSDRQLNATGITYYYLAIG